MALALVLSCEHAGNRVPREYAALFRSAEARALLATHRGWDPGALAVATQLHKTLGAPLHVTEFTRLLVEPNRSPRHPRLFSRFSEGLDAAQRERVLERYYTPHRTRVEQALRAQLARHARVLHVAVHSFTPVLDGQERNAEIGLLYDPARPRERQLAHTWQAILRGQSDLRVRRNYPYHGAADGLTTHLRRVLGPRYLGFELEINQRLLVGPRAERDAVAALLCESLAQLTRLRRRARP